MKKKSDLSIGVLGLWHLGSVYAACLASLGYKVYGFDQDKQTIDNLNDGHPPIYEPNLEEVIKKELGKKLFFSGDPNFIVKDRDYLFVTVDTPVDDSDQVDLTSVEKIFNLIANYASPGTTIVVSSQVPVGTTRKLVKKIKKSGEVIYFPENLRLGSAIKGFLDPDKVILGADKEETLERFLKDFPFFKDKVLEMSIESSEMVKHALNSLLALNISFASELGDLCEFAGADMIQVVQGLKSDSRVSPKAPINPGLGFAGGTLGRDVTNLIKLGTRNSYKAKLMESVYSVNQDRLRVLEGKIKSLIPNLRNKKIGLLGLTYKPNTDTLRRSFSVELARILNSHGAKVQAYDPAIKKLKSQFEFINLSLSLDELFKDLEMIILMTEWEEFKSIELNRLSRFMNKKIVLDTKNFLNSKEYLNHGFKYLGTGRNV